MIHESNIIVVFGVLLVDLLVCLAVGYYIRDDPIEEVAFTLLVLFVLVAVVSVVVLATTVTGIRYGGPNWPGS